MSIIYTPGGSADNSYGTVAEADAFLLDRVYSDLWTATSSRDREKALISFTRRLDQERFLGVKTTATQALKFPRAGIYNEDGFLFDPTTIPQPLKQALFIGAFELIKADTLAEDEMADIKTLETGTLKIERFDSAPSPQSSGAFSSEVQRLLRGLVITGGRIIRA